ncbi:phosphatase PAP2 family protein [Pseudoflavitalea sp. G-6-1-2]|uniref:phosphatase PAP2 family protein n=1 Tax=Pseudoflavitalea sp. G-6-1-2 TaxID=2728841 RepID=UPI00146C0BE6|nr:phosphatase PAP2 family protein [Pseudoflavitalea sp. G-6-1-2]NML21439.1 phosphatase PAP2 family protein [Pseudoflavitalea sp. G-6-1-2]
MMRFLLLLSMVCCTIQTWSQTDTMPRIPDSAALQLHLPERPVLKATQLLIPATLIGYGIWSLDNGQLESFNAQVKEELYTEKPHRQLHIDNYLQWTPALAVYALNAAGIKGAHNLKDRSIIYGLSLAIMNTTVFASKHLTKQWRPDLSNDLSFPSGHTANAFAAAEFLRKEYKDVSIWYGVGGYAVAAFTGYLRMYNNRHWLSDVVAGAGVGILSTDLAYFLYPRLQSMFKGNKMKNTAVAPFYSNGAVGLNLVKRF